LVVEIDRAKLGARIPGLGHLGDVLADEVRGAAALELGALEEGAGEAHLRDQAAQQRPRHDDDDIAVTRLIERHRLVDEFLGHLPSPFATSASALPWSALLSLSSTAGGIVADFCSSSSTFVVAAIRSRG